MWVLSFALVLLAWQSAASQVAVPLTVTAVVAVGAALFAGARRALRAATRQIDTILAEELGPNREPESSSPDFLSASVMSRETDQDREISTSS
jgi:hypothetical protein